MQETAGSIFDKILKGEIPCHKVHEDDDFLVILDTFPTHLGHSLIIPKRPAKNIYELDEVSASKIFLLAQKIAKVVQDATDCEGINILQNNGAAAEQTVFYFHMHVIPRFENDGIVMKRPTNRFGSEDFEGMAQKLAQAL
ncbi:MAG: HIT family protein [Defluviitaleaceae bacterium]|nr:HIT family protein [Defluviitaleaceae bacterium]